MMRVSSLKNNKLFLSCAVGLVVGSLGFIVAVKIGSGQNIAPVSMQFPAPGESKSTEFRIYTAGFFRLEISTKAVIDKNEVGLPDLPPIECDLSLVIRDRRRVQIETEVRALNHAGRVYSLGLDYFESSKFELPHAGHYGFTLTNRGNSPGTTTGAPLRLIRFFNPTDWLLRFGAIEMLSELIMSCSIIGLLIVGYRALRASRRPASNDRPAKRDQASPPPVPPLAR